MTDDTSVTPSSGNVFADLGLPQPELLNFKAHVLVELYNLIDLIKSKENSEANNAKLEAYTDFVNWLKRQL
jgi:hypothetical protein